MDVLIINDVVMPPVKSLTVTAEKIWSAKTGRVANGQMKGDLIAIKLKLQVVFVPLSDEQTMALDAAISQAYFEVKFRNPRNKTMESKTMYAGTPTYPVYSYAEGLPRYVGVGVDLIEQ